MRFLIRLSPWQLMESVLRMQRTVVQNFRAPVDDDYMSVAIITSRPLAKRNLQTCKRETLSALSILEVPILPSTKKLT